MNILRLLGVFTGVTFSLVGGVMAMGNPGQNDYERYATDQLAGHLKENVCTQISGELKAVFRSGCKTLVDTGRPQMKEIIAQTTRRQNFLLFSIYQTDLAFSSPIPSYQFETIGVMQKFYTYESDKY